MKPSRQITDLPVMGVFNAIKRAAEAGLPCPTNNDLATLIGAKSPSTAVNAVSFLATAGMITVERGNRSRVITVNSIGKSTAGRVKAPHWRERPRVQASLSFDPIAANAARAAADSELLDEIEVEAVRSGTPIKEMLTRLLWLGLNCHIDDVLAERGAA